ncbi:MAG: SDR family NAD(P)-dependent oxidoreductase [Burkholderiales bacterium]|nr:SDR family NAD(P)-dependent oxidoreductase [Burkholderiales bacterium]
MLIVGSGDVARRLVTQIGLADRVRWIGLARTTERVEALRQIGILPIDGDLDFRPSLRRAGALARSSAACVLLAPPPGEGRDDPRVRRWLAASVARARPPSHRDVPRHPRRAARPLHSVYVSTTGVYGDCAGEVIDETRRLRPTSARAQRRVAAEQRLRGAPGRRSAILRAPGIYAAERLPVERLRAGTPALVVEDDVFSNHIHADDLARAIWFALFRGASQRSYNVVDDAQWRMGDYFDRVARAVGLPAPRRLPRAQLVREVSPMLYSFMSESRRILNRRLKRELRLRLTWPTPDVLLRPLKPAAALQRSLL